jgi:hypothetical protein
LIFTDGPLLGHGSRIRRARSARLRGVNSGNTNTSQDQKLLFHHFDDASSCTSSDSGLVNLAFMHDQSRIMGALESFRDIKGTESGENIVC